jgi:hypothetical protein
MNDTQVSLTRRFTSILTNTEEPQQLVQADLLVDIAMTVLIRKRPRRELRGARPAREVSQFPGGSSTVGWLATRTASVARAAAAGGVAAVLTSWIRMDHGEMGCAGTMSRFGRVAWRYFLDRALGGRWTRRSHVQARRPRTVPVAGSASGASCPTTRPAPDEDPRSPSAAAVAACPSHSSAR